MWLELFSIVGGTLFFSILISFIVKGALDVRTFFGYFNETLGIVFSLGILGIILLSFKIPMFTIVWELMVVVWWGILMGIFGFVLLVLLGTIIGNSLQKLFF